MTFNLSNLNYIKKRLFEPEMRFFKEQLKEVYSEYTRGIKGDVQMQLAITSKDLSDKFLLLEQLVAEIEHDHRKVRTTVSSFGTLLNRVFAKMETIDIDKLENM